MKPKFCCSVCGTAGWSTWPDAQKPIVFDKRMMDWEERLTGFLDNEHPFLS